MVSKHFSCAISTSVRLRIGSGAEIRVGALGPWGHVRHQGWHGWHGATNGFKWLDGRKSTLIEWNPWRQGPPIGQCMLGVGITPAMSWSFAGQVAIRPRKKRWTSACCIWPLIVMLSTSFNHMWNSGAWRSREMMGLLLFFFIYSYLVQCWPLVREETVIELLILRGFWRVRSCHYVRWLALPHPNDSWCTNHALCCVMLCDGCFMPQWSC